MRKLVRKNKDRPTQTPDVVFVVTSYYQSLQIVVLLLQACLFGSLVLSCTLLLQQLQWLQRKSKDRPTRTPNVVIVVALQYQSLQIIVLLLQACLLESYLFCEI